MLNGFIIIGMVACSLFGLADTRCAEETYGVRRWGVEDGLPEGIVTAAAQFSDGFLWLTTPQYVVRFDGMSFVPYPKKAYPEQCPRHFNSILRDRSGRVWVVGENGVMRHEGDVWIKVPLAGNIRLDSGDVWRVMTPDGMIDQAP